MLDTLRSWKQTCCRSELSCGTVCVFVLACVCSVIAHQIPGLPGLRLDSAAVTGGHVHRLLTFVLFHQNVLDLALSALLMAFPCGGLERGIGSVRFLHRSLVLSSITGLAHVLMESLLLSPANRSSVNGLVPLALAVLGMMTISSGMQKAYIMGVSVPTASLPWIILAIITLTFPNTVFMCNVLAILTGILYGKGWFSLLEMSESRASVLEKKFPLRLLKQIPGVQFIPASAHERQKPLDFTDAPPGSYPVQAYTPVMAANGQAGRLSNTFDGWPVSLYPQQPFTLPSTHTGVSTGHGHDHGHGHGHDHSHSPSHGHSIRPWIQVSPYAQHQFRPLFPMTQFFSELPQPGVPPLVSESGLPTVPPLVSESGLPTVPPPV
ncbi:rhomboid domain-containing protein 2 isoform X2 [Pseudorasbora parva]|uniref:rhomboid domain-containing protein 2 isoform X2 n=1 Tax=Pseudorasbora parva TaxID=51549 RepID=UPI00351E7D2F